MLRRGQATVRPADLLARRSAQQMTQQQLAATVGCSEGMVAHAEKGRRNLSLESVIAFAGALGCRPSDIADIHITTAEVAAIAKAVA